MLKGKEQYPNYGSQMAWIIKYIGNGYYMISNEYFATNGISSLYLSTTVEKVKNMSGIEFPFGDVDFED